MGSAARPVSVSPEQVAGLLGRGVEADEIVRLLVATGAWSDSGAEEIVATLTDSSEGAERPGRLTPQQVFLSQGDSE